jgi:hypothetical protein
MAQYRVSGTQKVFGHEPGAVFTAVLDPEQESRLLERGSITRVVKDAPKKAGFSTSPTYKPSSNT